MMAFGVGLHLSNQSGPARQRLDEFLASSVVRRHNPAKTEQEAVLSNLTPNAIRWPSIMS